MVIFHFKFSLAMQYLKLNNAAFFISFLFVIFILRTQDQRFGGIILNL